MDSLQNESLFTFAQTVSIYNQEGSYFLYNWLNGEYAEVFDCGHFLYRLLESGSRAIDISGFPEDDDIKFLIENRFIVSSSEEFKQDILEGFHNSRTNENLELILLPAGQACNFDCPYCYEDHSERIRMGVPERDAILRYIESSNPRSLHIEYFGGEPLLNRQFIIDLNSEILKRGFGKENGFHSSMTTNGYYLTPDLFEMLLDLNVTGYQITLDGSKEDHDAMRPLKNGKATFDVIFNNLKEISRIDQSRQFIVDLRVNYNELSASEEKRKSFLKLIKDTFGHDRRFRIRFRPVSDYSSFNDKQNETNTYCSKDRITSLQKLYELEALENGLPLADLRSFMHHGSAACYAGKPNSIIIMPDLKVMKCTLAFDIPMNLVGHIDASGTLTKNENWDLWVKSSFLSESRCSACAIAKQCHGGACPLSNIKKGAVTCPGTINNLPHVAGLIMAQNSTEMENILEK